jgi:hypothetical protein
MNFHGGQPQKLKASNSGASKVHCILKVFSASV